MEPARTPNLSAGNAVGQSRYVLERELGRGGMGVVWLARDTALNDHVALKFLPPEIQLDAGALNDLKRETLKSRKLTHPHIIRIHDFCQFAGEAPFISMEFVEGTTLGALKIEQPQRCFAWAELEPWAAQLCAALDYAHGEGVVHRDLKPSNMMVDARGRLKLADFGLSASVSDSMSRVSMHMGSSGTLSYMSPQQLDGRPPKVTDDIHALGATLYELLTSKPPFHSGDVLHQIRNLVPDTVDQRLADLGIENPVPGGVAALLMACLAKDDAQRPQSAAAVAEFMGLKTASKPTGPGLLAATGANRALEPQAEESPVHTVGRSRWVAWTLAAVAVLGLVAGIAINRTDGKKSSIPPASAVPVKVASVVPTNTTSAVPVKVPTSKPVQPVLKPVQGWTNSLGMRFAPVPGTPALFSVWETRVQDYEAFVKATGQKWPKPSFEQGPTHPAGSVSWEEAKAFCEWLTRQERAEGKLNENRGYRLPTDAEWSLAVGLTNETGNTPFEKHLNGQKKRPEVFPWGMELPPPKGAGNYAPFWAVDSFLSTSPVGSFKANPYGLFDLGGNVSEWCEDLSGDKTQYLNYLVERGSSYARGHFLSSPTRYYGLPTTRLEDRGFRCVLGSAASELPAKQGGTTASPITTPSTASNVWTNAINLLTLIDPVKDRLTSGAWNKVMNSDGTIHSLGYKNDGEGEGRMISAPIALRARNYEIQVQIGYHTNLNGIFHVNLPIEDGRHVPIIFGEPGKKMINNRAGVASPALTNIWARLAFIRVTRGAAGSPDHVHVRHKNATMMDWQGSLAEVAQAAPTHPDFPGQPCPSLFVRKGCFLFYEYRLSVFDGEATLLRNPAQP